MWGAKPQVWGNLGPGRGRPGRLSILSVEGGAQGGEELRPEPWGPGAMDRPPSSAFNAGMVRSAW